MNNQTLEAIKRRLKAEANLFGEQLKKESQVTRANAINNAAELRKAGVFTRPIVFPGRALMTDYGSKLPPIPRTIASVITGGAYTPVEQSALYKLYNTGKKLNPEEIKAMKDMDEEQMLMFGLYLQGPKATGFKGALKGAAKPMFDKQTGRWISDATSVVGIDKLAKANPGRYLKLTDVYKHPQLYKDYPQLKNIKVNVWEAKDFAGLYQPERKLIELKKSLVKNPERIKRTIAHEVEHAVDAIEKRPYMGVEEKLPEWGNRIGELRAATAGQYALTPQKILDRIAKTADPMSLATKFNPEFQKKTLQAFWNKMATTGLPKIMQPIPWK